MSAKNQKLNLDKETLYDLYINKKLTSKECAEILGCTSKSIRNYLSLYGIPIRQNGDAVKLERSKWSDEKEQHRSLAMIQNWQNKPQEEKDEITRKKHLSPKINSPEAIAKANATRLSNNTVRKSQAEDDFYNKLLLFFNKDDIIRNYTDARYPNLCDFYIKSKDLFIEYQGHQSHGFRPYNPTDPKCWDDEEYMKTHGYDLNTWQIRDPKKLQNALNNKINLLLIYPKNDSYFVSKGTIKNIGKFNITKINELC